jgi:hypothetical protein
MMEPAHAAAAENRTFADAGTLAHDVAEWLCDLAHASGQAFAVCPQFAALEEPGSDENPIVVSIEPKPCEIAAKILSALNMAQDALPPGQASLQPSGAGA